ncbi:MAG TPA: cupredoxin domain-containing protein [Candidatus Binatus sp.]|jgi:nitrosocyanin|nr:cupredoxin domain-containing protein [Candidatus Binatus sp.]
MRRLVTLLPVALTLIAASRAPIAAAESGAMTVTIVNVEYEGSKMWLPGTIAVPKGTKVTVKLVNNVPSEPAQHGFAIPAYNIQEVVNRGEPKTIEFTADKPGVFPFNCQLHPAHVGGQLIVLP